MPTRMDIFRFISKVWHDIFCLMEQNTYGGLFMICSFIMTAISVTYHIVRCSITMFLMCKTLQNLITCRFEKVIRCVANYQCKAIKYYYRKHTNTFLVHLWAKSVCENRLKVHQVTSVEVSARGSKASNATETVSSGWTCPQGFCWTSVKIPFHDHNVKFSVWRLLRSACMPRVFV